MPNTFVDPYTYSRIVALAVFQDIGVSALSVLNDFMENGGAKLLTNSAAQYFGYVGASCVNNAVTPAILLPIIDNGVRACSYIKDDPSPQRVAAVALTYSLSAVLAAEADVPVNLAMSGLLVAVSQFMANAITAGGASIICKDSILKNSIKCQLLINQLPLAHQRILNVLLLGLDLTLIIVFVKTTRKRLRYYKRFFKKSYNVSKNVIKKIKTKAAVVKTTGLILLEPNPKCEGFDDLIDELVSLFDRFCPDPSLRESYEFSEEELKKLVQKIFIQMKDRYP